MIFCFLVKFSTVRLDIASTRLPAGSIISVWLLSTTSTTAIIILHAVYLGPTKVNGRFIAPCGRSMFSGIISCSTIS